MGKSYIENSLKRFLKRKVKITLGLVVTFMITGAVSFGAEITDIPKGYEDRVIVGKQTEVLENIDDIFTLKIDGKEETASLFVLDGATVFNDKEINSYPDKIKPQGRVYVKNAQFTNEGLINYLTMNGGEVINNGKIKSDLKNGHYMADGVVSISGKETVFINNENGEIEGRNTCIQIKESENAKIYNYGLIKSVKDNNGWRGAHAIEATEATSTEIYNYGKIIGNQYPISVGKNETILHNYNYLASNATIFGEDASGGTLKNYGLINYRNYLGNFDHNHWEQVPYKLENRGVMFRKISENFNSNNREQKFNNYGILFTDNSELKNGQGKVYNGFKNGYEVKGAVLDIKDFSLLNDGNGKKGDNTVKDMSGEKEINFSNTADNMFIKNESLTLNLGDKAITGKTITALSQKAKNVILSNDTDGDKILGNNNLTLDNTTIVGYFEKDGTLLKVDGDLTLKGNSIINAVAARDENGDILKDAQNVVAVDVYGKLTYTEGENHIFGIIKGGKGSEIVITPEKNHTAGESSSVNEDIKTSGKLTLEGEKWTKGHGSITLEGGKAELNVGEKGTGTLTGYLFGDSKDGKTTLDGMVTGNGNLNMGRMRLDLGNLDIAGLNDTFVIEGSDGIKAEDVINKIDVSGIFKKEIKNGDLVLSLKSADEMGIHDPAKQKEYEELVKNFKNSEDIYTLINTGDAEAIRNHLKVIDAILELLGTSGVKITRDLTGAFTDAVVEFDKKADKGQWLTNAKYIGSDMEYNGTKNINGYDSDIKSMVGMAEYGITENTSLGFALGGGDTEIDLKTLNGKSTSFDGNNYYAGIYAKHSMNGFDMTGSLGYTISELDVEKGGSADSKAFTLAGYVKRDVKLTDTVKLEPNVSFIYDYIMQDKAEMGEGMTIDSGDYHVFEAGAGLNLVKEFAFEKGSLKLKTGVKYSMINVERNQEVTGNFYNADVNLGSPDIDDTYGKAHVGFDYEHVSGFGVNGKYETMWSDSGDDSRVTAGISYRF